MNFGETWFSAKNKNKIRLKVFIENQYNSYVTKHRDYLFYWQKIQGVSHINGTWTGSTLNIGHTINIEHLVHGHILYS